MSAVEEVFDVVAASARDIRDSLVGRRTYEDEENPSGEQQLEADVYADQLLEERLLAIDAVSAYASEERDDIVDSDADSGGDGYSIAVDPLDGSSNVKSNNAMGTIVGVYDDPLPSAGRSLVAAAYVLYGPLTTMVTAHDETVSEYVIEDGVRRLVQEDVTLPDDPLVYGFGGRVPAWTDDFTDYVHEVEHELKLRYGGAMIADVNQVMTYGGIFAYPALESRPEGKLRLLFEGAPIAYIVESAGGRSSNGERSLLDVEATEIHQRVPVHVGNTEYVTRLEEALGT